jgi:hypothetical protein
LESSESIRLKDDETHLGGFCRMIRRMAKGEDKIMNFVAMAAVNEPMGTTLSTSVALDGEKDVARSYNGVLSWPFPWIIRFLAIATIATVSYYCSNDRRMPTTTFSRRQHFNESGVGS